MHRMHITLLHAMHLQVCKRLVSRITRMQIGVVRCYFLYCIYKTSSTHDDTSVAVLHPSLPSVCTACQRVRARCRVCRLGEQAVY